jgi:hypothetical protein
MVERQSAPAPVDGTNRRPGPPSGRQPRFTGETILALIRAWAQLYGEPPTMRDWEPSRARRTGQQWRAERYREGEWPSATMVKRQFGTFNAAIRAAGLTPRAAPRPKPHLTGPEQILAAVVEWTRRYGDPPTQGDWDPARARRVGQAWRIVRYRDGDWPSLNSVVYHFGSLGRAIEAAGLRPRRQGEHGGGTLGQRAHNGRAVAEIRAGASRSGAAALAAQVQAVAAANRALEPDKLRLALLELAAVALRWADDIAWGSD